MAAFRCFLVMILAWGWPAWAAAPPVCLTSAQQEKREELEHLAHLADETFRLGDLDSAIRLNWQVIARDAELYGELRERSLHQLRWLAAQHEQRGEFDQAIRAHGEALRQRLRKHGPGHWQVIDARRGLEDARQMSRLRPAQRRKVGRARQSLARAFEAHARGDLVGGTKLAEEARRLFEEGGWQRHFDYAQCLDCLAGLRSRHADPEQVLPLAREAVRLCKEAVGERHPAYLQILGHLSFLHKEMGHLAQALPIAREVLALTRQVYGEKSIQHAACLSAVAWLYQAVGEHARVLPLHREALAIRLELPEKGDADARSLNDLAALYKELGEHEKALPVYLKVLATLEQGPGKRHPDYAMTLNNLARLYQEMGQAARGLPLVQQSVELRRKALGENHPDYADSLHTLAALYHALGEHARALPLFHKALEVQRRALGERDERYVQNLSHLASLYQDMGEHAKALPLFQKALALRRKTNGDRHPATAQSVIDLAVLYYHVGDVANALAMVERAQALVKEGLWEKHPGYGASLNTLAVLYKDLGEHAAALSLFEKALEVIKSSRGEKHPHYIGTLNNLADLYHARGQDDRALELLEKSLALRKESQGEGHPDYALGMSNVAMLHLARGQYDRALPLLEKALRLIRETLGDRHPKYAGTLYNLALLHRRRGDLARALPLAGQSLALSRQYLDLTAAGQSEGQQIALALHLRHRLDFYLSTSRGAAKLAAGDHAEVLAWKGASVARGRLRRLALSEPDPKTREAMQALQTATRELSALALAPAPVIRPEERRKQMAGLSGRMVELEAELSSRSEAFRQLRGSSRLRPGTVQALLPARTALVDFFVYEHQDPTATDPRKRTEKRLLAFVLRSAGPVVRRELGALAGLGAAIDDWRERLEKRPGALAEAGAILRKRLWEPLEADLGGAATVLVSPDGPLCRLPFAALPGKKADYLIEEVAIAVVPVPQLLSALVERPGERTAAQASLLLVGNVDFDAGLTRGAGPTVRRGTPGGPLKGWGKLPATAQEVEAIRASFTARFRDRPVTELRGAKANKPTVRRAMGEHRYLHLATHGFFAGPALRSVLEGPPPTEGNVLDRRGVSGWHPGLLSGIVLAGANRAPNEGEEDGILTALEVAELDLSGVDLAVLSACETGLGELAGGEGVLGLQRAFQVAGCKRVVSSLWTVNDQATAALMRLFYRFLWDATKKRTPLEALRQAQLAVLDHPEKIVDWAQGRALGGKALPGPGIRPGGKRAPVRQWAGFVLSGDWR